MATLPAIPTKDTEPALDSLEQARRIAALAQEKLAEDVVILDMRPVCSFTDYFVICTGRNDRQVKTIADEVEEQLRVGYGVKPIGREGVREARWVLLDFGDLVVHIFQPEERDFYRLERLWGDAPRVSLPADITGPTAAPASQVTSE